MDEDQATATRVWTDDGEYVRVSETVRDVVDAFEEDTWAYFTDPGHEGAIAINGDRVVAVVEEPAR